MSSNITQEEEKRYEELQLIALDYARAGDTQELEKMIQSGMNVNLMTLKDDTLLMLSTYNGNYETSKMLIENDAIIDKINQRGQTPLEGVCFKGNLEIVKLLVRNGAEINDRSIIYSSMFGNKNIKDYLSSKNDNTIKVWGININTIASITSYLKNIFKVKSS